MMKQPLRSGTGLSASAPQLMVVAASRSSPLNIGGSINGLSRHPIGRPRDTSAAAESEPNQTAAVPAGESSFPIRIGSHTNSLHTHLRWHTRIRELISLFPLALFL